MPIRPPLQRAHIHHTQHTAQGRRTSRSRTTNMAALAGRHRRPDCPGHGRHPSQHPPRATPRKHTDGQPHNRKSKLSLQIRLPPDSARPRTHLGRNPSNPPTSTPRPARSIRPRRPLRKPQRTLLHKRAHDRPLGQPRRMRTNMPPAIQYGRRRRPTNNISEAPALNARHEPLRPTRRTHKRRRHIIQDRRPPQR